MNTESPNSPPQPTKLDLRQFSKQQDENYRGVYGRPTSRSDVARRLMHMRADRQNDHRRQAQINHQSQKDQDRIAEISAERLIFEQKATDIRNLIQDHETSFIKKVMARFREFPLEEYRDSLADVNKQADSLQRRQANLQDLHDTAYYHQELQHIQANQQAFHTNSQAYIDDYYDRIAFAWSVDKQARDKRAELEVYKQQFGSLEDQITAREQYTVHAIKPEFDITFGNNQNIDNQSSFQDRIAYMLTQKPTACTSTFQADQGDNRITLWDNFGLVVNKGLVEDASAVDKGSKATEDNRRDAAAQSVTDYQHRISAAISQGSRGRYNEVIISQPESVAMFLNLDQMPTVSDDQEQPLALTDTVWQRGIPGRDNFRSLSVQDILSTAELFGLPFVLFRNGQAYKPIQHPELPVFMLGEQISPTDFSQWSPPKVDQPQFIQMAQNASRKPLPMM